MSARSKKESRCRVEADNRQESIRPLGSGDPYDTSLDPRATKMICSATTICLPVHPPACSYYSQAQSTVRLPNQPSLRGGCHASPPRWDQSDPSILALPLTPTLMRSITLSIPRNPWIYMYSTLCIAHLTCIPRRPVIMVTDSRSPE